MGAIFLVLIRGTIKVKGCENFHAKFKGCENIRRKFSPFSEKYSNRVSILGIDIYIFIQADLKRKKCNSA